MMHFGENCVKKVHIIFNSD